MSETGKSHGFAPLNQTTGEVLHLSMQKLWLTGQVLALGARLWVRHEFVSNETNPVEVIYGFVLPRHASLRRFRISGDGFMVDSELRPVEEATKIYEEGIHAGSLSALARQYGDGLVNLTVGNIRPGEKVVVVLELLAGVELHDSGFRLRFPFTLAPSYHSQARGMEIAPGVIELELPTEQFGDLILPQFMRDSEHMHQVGFCLDVQLASDIREIASPSHALRIQTNDARSSNVSLSRENDMPDRDLVLDVHTKTSASSMIAGVDSDGKSRFAAIVPSTEFGKPSAGPRRLVFLLDRSGSMRGRPLAQAKKAIAACMGTLQELDLFGLTAFDNKVEVFKATLSEGNMENRHAALQFLDGIESRGGTELAAGVEAAAKLLRDGAGEILILTDGQVFGTETILQKVRSTGVRLHCLGIGSASQDRFLAQLANQTGGVSRFLTPNERVDLPALELFASLGRPVAQQVEVKVEGVNQWKVAPEPSRYVFSGTPLLVFGEVASGANTKLKIEWQGAQPDAHFELPIQPASPSASDTLKLLQGARIIADRESRCLPTGRRGPAARREASRSDAQLARLSLEYGLASSAVSLVAVVRRTDDVSGQLPKTRIVPVGIPVDEEYFLGASHLSLSTRMMAEPEMSAMQSQANALGIPRQVSSLGSRMVSRLRGSLERKPLPGSLPNSVETSEDVLVTLAGWLEPDGGMPGKNEETRIANSLVALLSFIAQGSTSEAGPFRVHVKRLLQYLNPDRVKRLGSLQADLVSRVLEQMAIGRSLKGDWLPIARKLAETQSADLDVFWREVAEGLLNL
jgi:Ca-activated chloride channel homolog